MWWSLKGNLVSRFGLSQAEQLAVLTNKTNNIYGLDSTTSPVLWNRVKDGLSEGNHKNHIFANLKGFTCNFENFMNGLWRAKQL